MSRVTIDGKKHPELFFRHELFDELVSVFCPANVHRDAMKAGWGSEIRSLAIDDQAFWAKLERSIGGYRPPYCGKRGLIRPEHRVEAVRIRNFRGEGEVTIHVDRQSCRNRYAVFLAARRAVGPATLDEVLYRLVGTKEWISYSSTKPHYVDELLYWETGCP